MTILKSPSTPLAVRGIRKHCFCHVYGRRSRVDRASVTLFDQKRQQPAVVQMSVGQNDGINGLGIYRKIAVEALRLFPVALVEPAIQ